MLAVSTATSRTPSEAVKRFFEDAASVDADSFYRFVLGELTRDLSLHYALLISRYIYEEDRKASLEVKLPSRVRGGDRQYCYDPLPNLTMCYYKRGSDLGMILIRPLYVNCTMGKLKRPGKKFVVSPLDLYITYDRLVNAGLDYRAIYGLANAAEMWCGETCSGEAAALEIIGRVLELSWDRIKAAEELFPAVQLPGEDYRLIEEAASYATRVLVEVKKAVAGGDIEWASMIAETPMEPLIELSMDPGVKVHKYEALITWIAAYLDRCRRSASCIADTNEEHDILKYLRKTVMKIAALRAIAEVMKSLIQPDGRI